MRHHQTLSIFLPFILPAAATLAADVIRGFDVGATSTASAPNATAAATMFNTTTATMGTGFTIDFEGSTLGPFGTGLVLSPLVTVTTSPTIGWTNQITDDPTTPTNGFNTSVAGSRFMKLDPNNTNGTLYFEFSHPIAAFGAFFSGLGDHNGEYRFRTNDSQWQGVLESGSVQGGLLFLGLSNFAVPTTFVSIEFLGSPDHIGVDDIKIVVPSPSSIVSATVLFALVLKPHRRR